MEPKTLNKRRLFASATLTIAATAALMVAFALPSASSASTARIASSTPLTMESSQETTLTDNFNPFVSTSAANTVGATSLIYESLLQFDVAKPLQAPYDFLASSYTWGTGGDSITFTIRSGVKWSDGSALTPADVAFSYNMLAQYPDLNTNGVPISKTTPATVSGQNVTITFTSSQYTNLQYVGSVYIVPQAIWSKLSGDPSTFTDTDPIGSGPYVLSQFSAGTGIVLTANQDYWGGPFNVGGGAPAVSQIDFPLLADAATVLSALETNGLDWAGNFINGLNGGFVNQSPTTHHVWFAPVQTNTLEPNLREWPMNQLAVRQAVSLAIDRNAISKQGESGLEPVATNASGIVLPNFSALEAPAVKGDKLSANANPKAADAVLAKAGYTLKGGFYALKGKVVDITITDPSNYSDYALDDQLMANELKAAHIEASFDGLSDNAWYADLADGKFGSATSHWSNTAILPYGVYDGWLDSTLNSPTNASGDFEGLNDPALDKDLASLAGATSNAQQLKYLTPLEQYVAKNLPVIPTVYGASFDEYSTAHFTGWPSASDQYESGSPNAPTNEVIVLHLKPVS
ncbi:MAG: ABC transporter substrate-binding protein [Solirubrobacteraceae bacterium]|jgi:peptide/nickel transport system substrate-binding protein